MTSLMFKFPQLPGAAANSGSYSLPTQAQSSEAVDRFQGLLEMAGELGDMLNGPGETPMIPQSVSATLNLELSNGSIQRPSEMVLGQDFGGQRPKDGESPRTTVAVSVNSFGDLNDEVALDPGVTDLSNSIHSTSAADERMDVKAPDQLSHGAVTLEQFVVAADPVPSEAPGPVNVTLANPRSFLQSESLARASIIASSQVYSAANATKFPTPTDLPDVDRVPKTPFTEVQTVTRHRITSTRLPVESAFGQQLSVDGGNQSLETRPAVTVAKVISELHLPVSQRASLQFENVLTTRIANELSTSRSSALANEQPMQQQPISSGTVKVLRLALEPAHLGSVDVMMRLSKGTMEIQMQPHQARVAALLRSESAVLQTVLQSIGGLPEVVNIQISDPNPNINIPAGANSNLEQDAKSSGSRQGGDAEPHFADSASRPGKDGDDHDGGMHEPDAFDRHDQRGVFYL